MRQGIGQVARGERQLVMIGADVRRHGAGGGEIGAAGRADRERLQRPVERARRQRRDHRRIQASGQKRADLDVGHQPLAHRRLQDQAQLAPDRQGVLARRQLGSTLRGAIPRAVTVGAVEQRAGADRLDRAHRQAVERLQLRCERQPFAQARHEQGLDTERIARATTRSGVASTKANMPSSFAIQRGSAVR